MNRNSPLASQFLKATTALVLSLAFIPLATGQVVTRLASMGEMDFTVESSVTTALYDQSSTSLTFSGAQSLGATLGGLWTVPAPQDWSSYQLEDFGIIASVASPNPFMPFTLELYDSSLVKIASFSGSTFGLTSSPSFVQMTLAALGTGDLSQVAGLQFTWDALDSINMEWEAVAAVPEPSVVALVALSAVFLAVARYRRRYRHGR